MVKHEYIWAILKAVGLGNTFLKLVQGLLSHAISKVHINGYFTEDFQVTRGVRQGFPLLPLIFALSTQPLMEMLQAKLASGYLQGIEITPSLTIYHRLFADNLGIFIPITEDSSRNLQGILHTYKLASGAKVNLSKRVIIPLAMADTPQWLTLHYGWLTQAAKSANQGRFRNTLEHQLDSIWRSPYSIISSWIGSVNALRVGQIISSHSLGKLFLSIMYCNWSQSTTWCILQHWQEQSNGLIECWKTFMGIQQRSGAKTNSISGMEATYSTTRMWWSGIQRRNPCPSPTLQMDHKGTWQTWYRVGYTLCGIDQ